MMNRGANGLRSAWVAALLLLAVIVTACGADPSQTQAQRGRAQIEGELRHAQQMGIPRSMLQSVITAERKTSEGFGGWGYSYQNAATSYAKQYAQLMLIEQQSRGLLTQQATNNIGLFSAQLNMVQKAGFVEAAGYQQRLDTTRQQLSTAKTPDDIANVSSFAQAQAQALQALIPTYDQIQTFKASLDTMQQAGVTSTWGTAGYTQDLAQFRAATSPQDYAQLGRTVRGQVAQLAADSAAAGPYVTKTILTAMQTDIGQLETYGEPWTTFQQNHDTDAHALSVARSPADFLTLLNAIAQQRDQMAVSLARGKTHHDIQLLATLVWQTHNKRPLLDYEYADSNTGIGDVEQWFQQAPLQNYSNPTCGWDVVCRYGQVDAEAVQMMTNLQAMLRNVNDKTAASQPHETDLQLMQDYGFMQGEVTVVSLREQVARAYQDGKLVYWSYVATGRPELPTPPGVQYTVSKQRHIVFQPIGPPGPVNGFPTPINWAVNFTSPFWHQFQGYFLHEAWWRIKFGPGSNLPHFDPSAFNTGSHGCINFPTSKMGAYYDWVQVGTPVIVY